MSVSPATLSKILNVPVAESCVLAREIYRGIVADRGSLPFHARPISDFDARYRMVLSVPRNKAANQNAKPLA